MPAARITWHENLSFVGVDSTDHGIVISTPDDKIGVKPSDLILMSLGSCTAYDMVNILTKKRQPLTDLVIEVSGEQDEHPPWVFTSFHMDIKVYGNGLSERAVREALRLSEEKYCAASATLRMAGPITHEITMVDQNAVPVS